MKKLLWKPSEEYIKTTNIYSFMNYINEKFNLKLSDYSSIYKWSIDYPDSFWGELWNYLDIKCSQPYDVPVDDIAKFPGAQWFVGAKLNYAENMLKFSSSSSPAIIFRGENQIREEISHRMLYEQVVRLAKALRDDGIKAGDTIAAYMPNMPNTVIAMLASAAIGAIWCSCATDIGPNAALDRLSQVKPTVLFTADGYFYKGKRFNVLDNASQIVKGINSIKKVIISHYAGESLNTAEIPNSVSWINYLSNEIPKNFEFEQLPSEHPLVVMFSSGTTGKPKCMVQSAAGLLINQLKELVLQNDVKPSDRMLYITTCSWMMWNWQAAALGTGSCIVLYDGNPSYPDVSSIWRILEEEKVTIFGLSASYVHSLMKEQFYPKDVVSLSNLRAISQTGSALSEEGFEYIYREIKEQLHFNSIAGGTDINGCFSTGNPISPVYLGELQGPGLGMKINSFNEKGEPVRDELGELVCEMPAPSMPIRFWNDPDNNRYMDAYFRTYPGVWHHGDYVKIHSDTGGISYYGRSDSTLKPSGVRIGTAEIYNQVEKLPQIKESLAIGQNYNGDERIILFVQTQDGIELDENLKKDIKKILKENASPRHVPSIIMQVQDIPRTFNGKKVESAVTNIINGRNVTNRDALENPESLDYFEQVLPLLSE
ncbi:acetoacetate--CoA ligase [Clostridium chromiireducens]|uniref:Acetyl-coenzyme A synthetase n=1 Tax=Clostridium chromiireducens TaxID=225345 RepID=A0A1V4IHQ9_9CLOT|nr:acetoacetate--CoA ligase [Clostridium chromiireducens]OPJ59354.1 acetyl-coenzyme A synthetase [Clostridium chromiireducens]